VQSQVIGYVPDMRPAPEQHPIGPDHDPAPAVLTLLQGYLANADFSADGRLPPERALAATLGVGRGELRKALAVLERQGALWRHVGKGTFLGARPVAAIGDLAALARSVGPPAVMQARLALEPSIAREAATNASAAQLLDIAARAAPPPARLTWRQFESADAQFHRTIAEATQNTVLLHLFDTLSAIRRAVTWARPRSAPAGPPPDHHSFAEHAAIARAIAERDPQGATAAMVQHLESVARNLAR
jgi:DNA-binding FadR family transcriptional regulator